MYEQPELNEVGDAQEVILGVDSMGYDFDGLMNTLDSEFADDGSQL